MKTIRKLKQSTSNFKNHFVRDSKVIVAGTLFMFMLLSVANVSAASYKIVYDDNVVSGMPEDIKSTTMNDSENISSDKPTRDGYSFLKWCAQIPASDGTCPGTEYDAGAALAISGTSENKYKLYAVWEEAKPYIQNLTLSQCQVNVGVGDNPENVGDTLTVYDKRDGKDYTVRYINGACWMTQNLRITGTISAEHSNFTGDDFNVSEYSLDKNDASYENHCDTTNGYNYACSKTSDDATVGAWYNYYAASAGAISGNSNADPATKDICPNGWAMPTNSQHRNIFSYKDAFAPITSKRYYEGELSSYSNWWSTEAFNNARRYGLYYDNGSLHTDDWDIYWGIPKHYGVFIRCVRSE